MLRGRGVLCPIFLLNDRAIYLRVIYNAALLTLLNSKWKAANVSLGYIVGAALPYISYENLLLDAN